MPEVGHDALEALRAEISGLRSELRDLAMLIDARERPRSGEAFIPYLSAPQIRARVGASSTTLWRWIRQGRFPRSKYTPGGRRVWPVEAIVEWEAGLLADVPPPSSGPAPVMRTRRRALGPAPGATAAARVVSPDGRH
jgi:prophage regulatory protein